MRVFVAGATGALGRPLVKLLIGRGHEVTGMTRRPQKAQDLAAAGATPAVADALDAGAVHRAVREAEPEALVHMLTALPPAGPRRISDLDATNRLRTVGTANLLAAAREAGVRRIVTESFAGGYGECGETAATEERPLARLPGSDLAPTLDALRSLEEQTLDAGGVALRYGLFYGPGTTSDAFARLLRKRAMAVPAGASGVVAWVSVLDAAAATLAVLEAARVPSVLNVADDEPVSIGDFVDTLATALGTRPAWRIPDRLLRVVAPYPVAAAKLNIRVSNSRLKEELGWQPVHPTCRSGLPALYGPKERDASAG